MKVRDNDGLIECIGFDLDFVVKRFRDNRGRGFELGYISSREVAYAKSSIDFYE